MYIYNFITNFALVLYHYLLLFALIIKIITLFINRIFSCLLWNYLVDICDNQLIKYLLK